MLLAFHARDVSHQQRPQLAGIRVAPAPKMFVVAQAHLPALHLAATMLHLYLYLFVCNLHVHQALPGGSGYQESDFKAVYLSR